jgi:hypothetical protein
MMVLIIGAVMPRAVLSQNRWEREVHDQLQRALHAVQTTAGGRPLATTTGVLNEEEAETFSVTLERGVAYSILGVCDNDCARLQLVLVTPANNELALDRNSENFPVLQFTPTVTMQYRIRVVMERCRMTPCWYAVGVAPLPLAR